MPHFRFGIVGVNVTDAMKQKLPTVVTMSRIFLAFVILPILSVKGAWGPWVAAILFALASLTDWLDGYLARKWKVESDFGKLMDPIADKILVLVVLVQLLHLSKIDPLVVIVLLTRDILIGGLRAAAAYERIVIAARTSGKWKTAFQMSCIPCLILDRNFWGIPIGHVGYVVLWISALLSLISGIQYVLGYRKASLPPKPQ